MNQITQERSTESRHSSAAPLESILFTEELNQRPGRPADYQTENCALVALTCSLAEAPQNILQTLADKILEIFHAGSAGISLLSKDDGGKSFYWPAIAGVWKPQIGGGTPRDFGPCGDVLDHNAPLMFRHCERRYLYLSSVTPPIEECLLVPFYVGGKAVGTIWAVFHDEQHHFDAEDLRILTSLGGFASAAYQTIQNLEELEHNITERKRVEQEAAQGLRFFQSISRATPDLVFVYNLIEQRNVYVNRSLEAVLGYTEEQLRSMPGDLAARMIHPDDLESIRAWHRAFDTAAEGEVLQIEHRTLHANGSYRWMLERATVFTRTPDGRAQEIIGVALDITERKESEQAIADQAAQQKALFYFADRANRARTVKEIYDAALDAITEAFHCDRAGVLFKDRDGIMRFTAWRGLSDAYRAAVEGHSPWSSDDRNPQVIAISNVAEAKIDEPIRCALEAEGIAAMAFIPITDREQVIGKFMVYGDEPRELTAKELQLSQTIATTLTWAIERKSSEEHLERLVYERTAKLEETVTDLEGFSYSITHDLRAPLRALQGFSHVLEESYAEKLDPTAKDYFRRITNAACRMDKLIQDVLAYSRVLRTDLRLERVDVEKLLRGMLESYPDFQEPKANVRIDGELPAVLANEAALTQCFSNLLNNAVKFVSPETKPRVRISAERRGARVRLWVEDNGIGIDPKYFENIFGTFHRLNTTYEGTGIGLTIVRKAAERMGGKAGVESTPGQGSRFWIELKPARS